MSGLTGPSFPCPSPAVELGQRRGNNRMFKLIDSAKLRHCFGQSMKLIRNICVWFLVCLSCCRTVFYHDLPLHNDTEWDMCVDFTCSNVDNVNHSVQDFAAVVPVNVTVVSE